MEYVTMRKPQIRIIGAGGTGIDIINLLASCDICAELICVDTDKEDILRSKVKKNVLLNREGCRAVANGEKGSDAADKTRKASELIGYADLLIIIAGAGGKTGAEAAPAVAGYAHDLKIPTLAVVVEPFGFEGSTRVQNADRCISGLREKTGATVVYALNSLTENEDAAPVELVKHMDDSICSAIRALVCAVTNNGQINVDMADVRRLMYENSGMAYLAAGIKEGKDAVEKAAEAAADSRLIKAGIRNAKKVLLNITCSPGYSLDDIKKACKAVYTRVNPDAEILFGSTVKDGEHETAEVVLFATGIES